MYPLLLDKNQKQMSVIYSTIEEAVSGIRTVKSFAMEDREIKRFSDDLRFVATML